MAKMSSPRNSKDRFDENMKHWPLSLRIFLMHTAITVTSILLMMSPLGQIPSPIHPILILPFFYLLFSGLPYLAAVIRGFYELWKGVGKFGSGFAGVSSLLILASMWYCIARNLDALMSV